MGCVNHCVRHHRVVFGCLRYGTFESTETTHDMDQCLVRLYVSTPFLGVTSDLANIWFP